MYQASEIMKDKGVLYKMQQALRNNFKAKNVIRYIFLRKKF